MTSRPATEIVHFKLRLREHLRARLEAEADKHATSINSEITALLEYALTARVNDESIRDLKVISAQFRTLSHGLSRRGDLIAVLKALIEQIESNAPRPVLEKTIKWARDEIAAEQWEAGQELTAMRTPHGENAS